ncbi:MAG: hypothetical protein M0R69_08835 [Candidatus Cloacimonetes bacterium]|jgi:hypothetical protein|nr:hypothetical protein [Candidatus Cloacimonadota bacterium]
MKMMRNYLLLLMICFITSGYAVELPLYAKWQSLHTAYYDEDQSGKELSWDELYRAEFGLNTVFYKDTIFKMAVDTEQFFDESHLRLKSIYLGVIKNHWVLAAGSKEHGFGGETAMNSYPILARGFDPYQYQSMRLNSLELIYHKERWQAAFNLGGNVHNQATAMIDILSSQREDYHLGFHQEFRAMDNHWRTPVLISAIKADYSPEAGRFQLDNSFAVSLLPGFDATQAHHELFLQSEISYQATASSSFGAAAQYQSREYAPKELQLYQIRVRQDFKDFALIPITELNVIESDRLWQHRLLGRYYLAPHKSIGIFYEYSHFDAQNPRHTVGLELDFTVDYAAASGL